MIRVARSLVAALVLLAVTAAVALAHPLGNFTINHYAGIRVEPDRIRLDVVIDEAEIPTFQITQGLDTDGDGTLSASEIAGVPVSRCLEVASGLRLTAGGATRSIVLVAAGVRFPPGNGGLPTMRLVCELESAGPVADGASIAFRDDFESARIGWREITAIASGMTIASSDTASTSESARLTAYPVSLAAAPDVRELSFDVRAGGPILPDSPVPDADQVEPVTVPATGSGPAAGETVTGSNPAPVAVAPVPATADAAPVEAAVPGGADALPDVLRRAPVDPLLALVSLLVAAALGAGHALTPGHGKTLMAAYLVGTRGTRVHALGLGLTVSVTHTIGILVLAMVVLAAESALPADLVVRIAPVVAAGSIVVVGSWMLLGEVRRRAAARAIASPVQVLAHTHGDATGHSHGPSHDQGHDHAADDRHDHEHLDPYPHPYPRPRLRRDAADHGHAGAPDPGMEPHRHGLVAHRHLPVASPDGPMRWRSLAVLGLAGGLIPSANALLILLGTIAAGRPAWGVVLVAAFGVGMAGVMAGLGLIVVQARSILDRAPRSLPFAAGTRLVPLAASLVVLVFGIVLSAEAIGAARLG